MDLADNKCVPCRGAVPPMDRAKAEEMLKQLDSGWALNKDGHLERFYTFKDFSQALAFVNKVGAVAEQEGIWLGASARLSSGRIRSMGSRRAISIWPPSRTENFSLFEPRPLEGLRGVDESGYLQIQISEQLCKRNPYNNAE